MQAFRDCLLAECAKERLQKSLSPGSRFDLVNLVNYGNQFWACSWARSIEAMHRFKLKSLEG